MLGHNPETSFAVLGIVHLYGETYKTGFWTGIVICP